MNASTDWMSALAILAAGLVLGSLVFFVSRRRKASAASKRRELEARRDALVQQLRDLPGDVADDERAWLERETADVLRALDGLPAKSASEIAAAIKTRAPRRHAAAGGFVWGIVCTMIAGGIIYYGSTFARERETAPATATAPGAQSPTELQQLEEAVRTDPNNADHRIALARAHFGRNDLMAAFEQTKAVLEQNPNEPRALTYNAVVRMAMGELDGARAMLEQATELDPKLLDAWVALASVRTRAGDQRGASAAINAAISQHPEEETRLRGVFAEMQKQATAAAHPSEDSSATAAAAPTAMPPGHPPLPSRTASTPASALASQPIRVTLSLDPSSSVKSGVVYVIARGAEAGHPLAVRRIETAGFPLQLDLGGNDTLMGQPLPPKVRIEARLDTDGDAGTTDPADPKAFANGVTAGTAVSLTLAKTN